MNKNLSKQLKEQQADKILLQAIAASADADAFLILYNRYSQRLLQYFYNVTDNADTAFDLSQNFWLNIWQNASQLIYENMDSAESLFFNMATKPPNVAKKSRWMIFPTSPTITHPLHHPKLTITPRRFAR